MPADALLAVKRYKKWVLEQPGQYERIMRELAISRRLSHPNLVKAIGLIADPTGTPALVMARVEGPTLDRVLQEHRALGKLVPTDSVVRTLLDLASGLSALHSAGAVHRDVKPANIILSPSGAVLMDLGVVRHDAFSEQTETGHFLGTIRYAAPEYLFDGVTSPSVDVYSLGAIAYELFVGEPFLGHEAHWTRLVRLVSFNRLGELRPENVWKTRGRAPAMLYETLLLATLGRANERWSADSIANYLNGTHRSPLVAIDQVQLRSMAESLITSLSEATRTFLRELFVQHYWKRRLGERFRFVLEDDTPIRRELEASELIYQDLDNLTYYAMANIGIEMYRCGLLGD